MLYLYYSEKLQTYFQTREELDKAEAQYQAISENPELLDKFDAARKSYLKDLNQLRNEYMKEFQGIIEQLYEPD